VTTGSDHDGRYSPLLALLCGVFLLSGASALLFETVWFRLAGLALGNSVWASSLVLASFMGGLGLGNLLSLKYGARLKKPVRTYAALELLIGLAGLGIVLVLPRLTPVLAPLFRAVADDPWSLNPLRLMVAFGLLLAPTTAMGATLPVLVRPLSHHAGFGAALGYLYGWNTVGATLGSLAGETLLVPAIGVTGTGVAAALLNLIAAAAAWALSGRFAPADPSRPAGQRRVLESRSLALLLATFLCGAALLMLEVLWFRFLQLFVLGTSPVFAAMLAVVLLGIGVGGLLGAWSLQRWPQAYAGSSALLSAAGASVILSYAAFADVLGPNPSFRFGPVAALTLAAPLMLAVSVLSGLLFTLLGRAVHEHVADETRAAGALTLANTLGAMVGSLGGGFLLLPRLGIERGLFAAALLYGAAAIAAWPSRNGTRVRRVAAAAAFVYLAVVALFPFGLMANRYLRDTARRFAGDGSRPVLVREGLTETLLYLRKDVLGQATHHMLVTNGVSMSGTMAYARRYMKLYVYWPVALHQAPRRALLISYGVGSTAQALVDTRELVSIDVVDISSDVLEASRIVQRPGESHPLDDPRVSVHVEDGRFFLLATGERYDIITAEPPPPKSAGIVSLYSKEYFQLLRDRLADGGMVTYWLPVFLLDPPDTRAIIKGFCSVFADCSLWNGAGLDWMLTGTRSARGPVSEQRFVSQWADPAVGAEMRTLGFEAPEQLGALFLAGASDLQQITRDDAPLEDDHPYRLSARVARRPSDPWYLTVLDPAAARERYQRSELVRRLWPPRVREQTLPWFDVQHVINDAILGMNPDHRFAELEWLLKRTSVRSLALWRLGSGPDIQRAIEAAASAGVDDTLIDAQRGLRALAERDPVRAHELLERAASRGHRTAALDQARAMALCIAGRPGEAALWTSTEEFRRGGGAEPAFLAWLKASCGA
jgi:predicted membrane-bound spermidine synthase